MLLGELSAISMYEKTQQKISNGKYMPLRNILVQRKANTILFLFLLLLELCFLISLDAKTKEHIVFVIVLNLQVLILFSTRIPYVNTWRKSIVKTRVSDRNNKKLKRIQLYFISERKY